MASRVYKRPTDKSYLGNDHKMEVHYLRSEDTSGNGCQIDEFIEANHAVVFAPDTLKQAKSEGYDPCDKCLPGSTR